MTTTRFLAALCTVALLGVGSEAQAQMRQWNDRGYVTFSLGAQPQSRSFTEISAPLIYDENTLVTVPHTVSGGLVVDVSGGIRVWKNLAIGIGFARFGASNETPTLAAMIPNPLIFNSPRSADAIAGEMSHSESAIHLQFLWMIPVSNKIEVGASLGPSFVSVKQDLVSGFTTTEGAPPFSTVTIASVATSAQSKGGAAMTAGVDATYLIARRMGAGGFMRYSRLSGGEVYLPGSGAGTISVSAGGFQAGAGLRIRF